MRIRAGAVLIENDKVALIERIRGGNHYYVFPGGGVDEGETIEEAAIREMEEETVTHSPVSSAIREIYFGLSTQYYFLAERVGGKYGTGTGEEFTDADPDDPTEGIYLPIWMPMEELAEHEKVYPADIKELVLQSRRVGWPEEPVVIVDPIK